MNLQKWRLGGYYTIGPVSPFQFPRAPKRFKEPICHSVCVWGRGLFMVKCSYDVGGFILLILEIFKLFFLFLVVYQPNLFRGHPTRNIFQSNTPKSILNFVLCCNEIYISLQEKRLDRK